MPEKPPGYVELLPRPAPGNPPAAGRPYPPFPVEALPAGLADYVREGSLALGCDAACLALPALAVVASAVGTTRVLRVKPGWDEPCALWAVLVGDGGRANATAYRQAVAYLLRLQEKLLTEYREQSADYRRAYQKARRQVVCTFADPFESLGRPVLRRVVCGTTSAAPLADILAANPRGTLVARHELDGWLQPFTRAAGRPGGRDGAAWLDLFFGGALFVDRDRGTPGHQYVPRAGVSVTGILHPRVLARLLRPDAPGAGLAGLLLLAQPPQVPRGWSAAGLRPEVERAYHDLLGRLLALDFEPGEGDKLPRVLCLSAEAMAGWVAFYDECSASRALDGGQSSTTFSHAEGYAARLALVHHVASCVGRQESDLVPVGAESVAAGVALCRWFAAEAEPVRAVVFESADEHRARCLAEFIRERGGRIGVRDLMRFNNNRYPDADSARNDLATLVQLGLARWSEQNCQNGSRAKQQQC